MRLATVAQAKVIDQLAQSEFELPAELLMEAAGHSAARELDLVYLPELSRGVPLAVVCGPGHNGADGLVLARHLHAAGRKEISVFLWGEARSRSEVYNTQLRRIEHLLINIFDLQKNPEAMTKITASGLIVDALFGVGLRDRVEGDAARVIATMNAAHGARISLDCPSGLNCDSGRVAGAAVRASMTCTFGLAKPGFFVADGPSHVGRLRVLPIGFPPALLGRCADTHFLFTDKQVRRYLPTRADSSNKSDHGRLLIIAGQPGFWGAGILASSSAFRVGTGYVTWASFEAPYESLREIPEVLTAQVDDDIIWKRKLSAVVIGPGLDPGPRTAALIEKLKTLKDVPVVVDAGALSACAEQKLFPLPENWVLTPHAGELGRVLGWQTEEIERDRFRATFEAARVAGCHVLFKGFRTLVAHQQRCWVIHAGNAALAKAGTGDVLAGMLGGLLAQGLATDQAAATAAYLHGRLADEWLRRGFDRGALTASDLKADLPQLIADIRQGSI